MPTTITDVAKKAGVSKSTVSRYLNGKYECMGAETKERIAQVIAELGYQPNALARSLKQKRTHTIAAIVANILNPYSTSVIRGIEDYCQQSGFNLIICNADDDPVKEKEYIEMLMAKQIDGLIISTTERNNDLLRNVSRQIPIVLVGRNITGINCDIVTIDNAQGVRLVIDHLVSMGHRRIAMFTMPYRNVNITPRFERVEGYKKALERHGIDFWEQLLVEAEIEEQTIYQRLTGLFADQALRPTAIFGANDRMAMEVVKVLKKMRINIPRGVAVIGFDDWEWASLIEPPITVVAQPAYDMGEKAASLLLRRLKTQELAKKSSVIVYQPSLIPRKSCGEM